jgi:hypothetical protein
MKKAALFTVKQGSWIETGLIPLGFALALFFHSEFVLGSILYLSVAWIYRTLAFRYVRITGKFIIGFCYERPLRKTYGYPYSDIVQVCIPLQGRGAWRMTFIFRGGASITSNVTDDIEAICRHFIDNRVPVESSSSYIRNIIVHHLARPQIDPRKQIALRKAREAARKARLTKLRRS